MLSSKTFEDVNTLEGKFQLRSELMAMFNQFLATGMITRHANRNVTISANLLITIETRGYLSRSRIDT